jgi:hypothetical protein
VNPRHDLELSLALGGIGFLLALCAVGVYAVWVAYAMPGACP